MKLGVPAQLFPIFLSPPRMAKRKPLAPAIVDFSGFRGFFRFFSLFSFLLFFMQYYNRVIKPVYATLKWDQKGGREIPGLQNRHYNLHFVLFILCILFSVSNGKPSYGGSSKENRSFGVHSNSWHSVSIIS